MGGWLVLQYCQPRTRLGDDRSGFRPGLGDGRTRTDAETPVIKTLYDSTGILPGGSRLRLESVSVVFLVNGNTLTRTHPYRSNGTPPVFVSVQFILPAAAAPPHQFERNHRAHHSGRGCPLHGGKGGVGIWGEVQSGYEGIRRRSGLHSGGKKGRLSSFLVRSTSAH